MSLLTEDQRQRLRDAIYVESRSCYNCRPVPEEGTVNYRLAHWPLSDSIEEAWARTLMHQEVSFSLSDNTQQVINELDLHCPSCGIKWTDEYVEVGDDYRDENVFKST
jgi:hypothetical protein